MHQNTNLSALDATIATDKARRSYTAISSYTSRLPDLVSHQLVFLTCNTHAFAEMIKREISSRTRLVICYIYIQQSEL